METISFQYLKYPFHWKLFFYLLEIYFKQILYNSQWWWISCLLETIFFHSDLFGNYYCNWRRVIFFKKLLFLVLQRKPFSSFFFQILPRMEVAFRFSEMAFLKGSFILASGNGFPMLEIRCKPVLFDFFNS